jgi:hypothetical protein
MRCRREFVCSGVLRILTFRARLRLRRKEHLPVLHPALCISQPASVIVLQARTCKYARIAGVINSLAGSMHGVKQHGHCRGLEALVNEADLGPVWMSVDVPTCEGRLQYVAESGDAATETGYIVPPRDFVPPSQLAGRKLPTCRMPYAVCRPCAPVPPLCPCSFASVHNRSGGLDRSARRSAADQPPIAGRRCRWRWPTLLTSAAVGAWGNRRNPRAFRAACPPILVRVTNTFIRYLINVTINRDKARRHRPRSGSPSRAIRCLISSCSACSPTCNFAKLTRLKRGIPTSTHSAFTHKYLDQKPYKRSKDISMISCLSTVAHKCCPQKNSKVHRHRSRRAL